jgi:hypothetical protein
MFDSESGGSDDAEALRWYTLAADQGHPEAMFHVAQYNDPSIEVYVPYEDRQVYLDENIATGWYKRAAAAGNELAPLSLHRLGEYDEALRWLLPLADKKKAVAKERDEYAELCLVIGQCYERCSPVELGGDIWTGHDNFEAYIAERDVGRRNATIKVWELLLTRLQLNTGKIVVDINIDHPPPLLHNKKK